MENIELSPEDERHLLNLSVIPAALVTYLLLALLVYFGGRNELFLSPLSLLVFFGIPFAILIPTTIFFSFEVLYSRKARRPISHGAKRFLGRMSLVLLAVSVLGVVLCLTHFAFTPWFDEGTLLVLTGVVWFALWGFLISRFRRAFGKLSAGKW